MKTGNWDAVRPPEIEILKYNEQWMFESFKSTREIMSEWTSKKFREIIHDLYTAREILLTSFFHETVVRVPFLSEYSLLSICSAFSNLCFSVKKLWFLKILRFCKDFICLFLYVFGFFTLSSVKDRCFRSSMYLSVHVLKHWKSLLIFPQRNNVAKFWKIIWLF